MVRTVAQVMIVALAAAWPACSPREKAEPAASRAGAETAAERRPGAPEAEARAGLPADLPREPLTRADRARWRAILAWPDDCESAFEASQASETAGLTFLPLAPGVSLVRVTCAAGAYQPASVYVRLDERGPTPSATTLRFPVLVSEDGSTLTSSEETELWGEAVWSADTHTLAVLNLVRQTRDCGIWTSYRIAPDEAPGVVSAHVRLPCPARPREPVDEVGRQPPAGWRAVAPPTPRGTQG